MKSFEIGAKSTVVFFLHGLRGHGLSQKAALQHMVKNLGVSLISLEMEGHGPESKYRHCLVPHYAATVHEICDEVQRMSKDAEQVVLMGYSFGASLMLLAADQLNRDAGFTAKVAGVVGISTAFHVGHNVASWKLWLSRAIGPLSRFLFERASRFSALLTIHEMNLELISADPTVVKAIAQDPLVYKGRIPLATSAQVYLAGLEAWNKIRATQTPTLLLHSQDDLIALPPNEQLLPDAVDLRMFKALRHNCIDGISKEVVLARKYMTRFIASML